MSEWYTTLYLLCNFPLDYLKFLHWYFDNIIDNIHKQGYYIISYSCIDFGCVFGVEIQQISSAWIALLTSVAVIGWLE